MPACDTSMFRFGVKTSGAFDKHRRNVEHDARLERAYRAVDAREDMTCQVTGVRLFLSSRDDRRRAEHHHLRGRNVKPEWVYQPRRIALVSAAVHNYLTDKALLAVGDDARTVRWRWNEHIVGNKPPFRLRASVAA